MPAGKTLFVATWEMMHPQFPEEYSPFDTHHLSRSRDGMIELVRIPERPERYRASFAPVALARRRVGDRNAKPRKPFPLAAAIDSCVLALRDGGPLALANRLKRLPVAYLIRILKAVIERCREETDFAQRLRQECERANVSLEDWLDYIHQQKEEANFA